jgi:ligand-binding sensor domain-containing protein
MEAGRGRGHWRTFDATDGLPGGVIRAVLQDRAGYLWIGSFGGGLSRYDGHSFKPLELTSRRVQSVIEDLEGNLWIGTYEQGLFRYDGQGFAHFTTQDGLAADTVLRVFQDREGQIWAGTINGLSRYDGHGFESFTTQNGLPGDQVHAIFQSGGDALPAA